MDKRYVGRWQRVSGTEIIDIFDEEPPRVKLSFPENGYYNYPPNKCYFNAGRFCYEINDEYYRMVYSLIYEDGRLRGHYTQFGIETEIAFELCDAIPRDEPRNRADSGRLSGRRLHRSTAREVRVQRPRVLGDVMAQVSSVAADQIKSLHDLTSAVDV